MVIKSGGATTFLHSCTQGTGKQWFLQDILSMTGIVSRYEVEETLKVSEDVKIDK